MKKAGVKKGEANDTTILLVIGAIMVIFIFGLKPIYKVIVKIKNGTLFETVEKQEEKEEKQEEVYKILKPVGASQLVCTRSILEEGGEQQINIILYHTNNRLKSIKNDIEYSGNTDTYTNYILSEQNVYKQRKNNNLKNLGYSVDINLISTSNLEISEVILLEKTDVEDISEEINMKGTYNQDIYEIANEYMNMGYACEW